MKFSISGAQSTGKSTIIKAIQERKLFPNNTLVTEVVRTLALKGIKINKGADHKSQMMIFEEHYKNTLRYDNLISDRSSLDAFAYATWDYLNGSYTYEEHKQHEAIFLDTIKNYHLTFYVAPEFPIVDDGFRSTDFTYQTEIHNIFLKLIKKYDLPVVCISGTVDQRVNIIQDSIIKNVSRSAEV